MSFLLRGALETCISFAYRISCKEAPTSQLILGALVMHAISIGTSSCISKVPFPALLSGRISGIRILEASKCIGSVFIFYRVYTLVLSLLIGRSWLVKAVILGIQHELVSSLIKRAITTIFWNCQARKLQETESAWNDFLQEHKIIPKKGTVHDVFKKAQTSFFIDYQRIIDVFRSNSGKNKEEIKNLDSYNWTFKRLCDGGLVNCEEFSRYETKIRDFGFAFLNDFYYDQEKVLLLRKRYDALVDMAKAFNCAQQANREISEQNDSENLQVMATDLEGMEEQQEWGKLDAHIQVRLFNMRESIKGTQFPDGSSDIRSLYNSPAWDIIMRTVELVNQTKVFDNSSWWDTINKAASCMEMAKEEYLAYSAINNWGGDNIRELFRVSRVSESGVSLIILKVASWLFPHYPGLFSSPVLVDATMELLHQLIVQSYFYYWSFPQAAKELPNKELLARRVLPLLEEACSKVEKLKEEYDTTVLEETDPA